MKFNNISFVIIIASLSLVACNQEKTKTKEKISADKVVADSMIWIPDGEFTMGTDDPQSYPNERPSHHVKINGFWIDKYDVTNADFRKFVEATGYVTTAEKPVDWEELKKQLPQGTPKPDDSMLQPGAMVFTPPQQAVDLSDMTGWWTWTIGANWKHPQGPGSSIEGKDNYPVVQVSWDDAAAYAKWTGKRLPTEAEWEYASRGGSTNSRYYWGNNLKEGSQFMANTFTGQFPYMNTAEDGYAGVAPVGSFPPNHYGLYDMAGNVWQWTADLYVEKDHAKIAAENCMAAAEKNHDCCQGTDKKALLVSNNSSSGEFEARRVTKGGSFLCNPSYCESYRPSARRGTPYDTGMEHIGFRCVKNKADVN